MKIKNVEITQDDGSIVEWVIIEHDENNFTSMLKSTYEAQQAAQVEHLTEIPTPDEA